MGMTRNGVRSLAKGNGIPHGDIYEAALHRKWLKPMELVSLQAELGKVLRQGMVMDWLTDDLWDYSAQVQWLQSYFSEENWVENPAAEQRHEIPTFSVA